MDFELFFRALGLAFVLEGVCWALFPEQMRKLMQQVTQMEQKELRSLGLSGVVVGVIVIWLAVHFG
ncbi:MAG: DUF2065 domain-containing protein [Desulfovibrionaceae bacterium]|nr:DUF2065 domain-containing protein [Desulfovibrionaceae bacterium]